MKTSCITACLLGFSLLIQPSCLQAEEYYVRATGGSNQNNGLTPQTAWATITHALEDNVIAAGDEIYIISGTYSEGEIIPIVTGTSQASILVTAAPDDVAILDGTFFNFGNNKDYYNLKNLKICNNDADGIYIEGSHDWLEFHNLTIQGNNDNGFNIGSGFDAIGIYDCDIHNNGLTGIVVTGTTPGALTVRKTKINLNSEKGIAYTGDFNGGNNSLIDSCQIINNFESGIDFHPGSSTIRWNYIAHNGVRDTEGPDEYGDKGLALVSESDNCLIHNNVICSSGGYELIAVGVENEFYNNTIIKDHIYRQHYNPAYPQSAACIIIYDGAYQDNVFKNNLIINYCRWTNAHWAVETGGEDEYDDQFWDYNMYWCPNASGGSASDVKSFKFAGSTPYTMEEIQNTFGQEVNSWYWDPWFVSYPDSNFNLYYGELGRSEAIENGTEVGLPFIGDRPDIGAFESDFVPEDNLELSPKDKAGFFLKLENAGVPWTQDEEIKQLGNRCKGDE